MCLHVVVDGSGPGVVLVGGLGGNWFDWEDTAELLSRTHTVVRFDRPGFGLSAPHVGTRAPTVIDEVDRIAKVLDTIGLREPVVIVGHSLGAFYAEGFARLHRERIAGVVLVDGSAERHPWTWVPRSVRVWGAHRFAVVCTALGIPRAFGPAVRRVLNHSVPPGGYSRQTRTWIDHVFRNPAYLDAVSLENAVYRDMAAELNELRRSTDHPEVPVAVVAADTGRPSPWARKWLATQQRLAGYLDASYHVIRPAYHHAMIDQPAEMARIIDEVAAQA